MRGNRLAGRMRRRTFLVALLAVPVLGAAPLAAASLAAAAPAAIHPGAPWKDQHGNLLQLHGLGIIKVANTWYGFGEDKVGETKDDTSFRAIPCYSSTNLATWTFVRESLIHQRSGDLGPHRIVERPKVVYNSGTGKYVMWMHIDNSAYQDRRAGVATSSTPCGPYTYLGASDPLGHQSRDLGLFKDDDGTAYLMHDDPAGSRWAHGGPAR